MAAGVTDRLWEIGDIVKVLERWEAINRAEGIDGKRNVPKVVD
jgi:hypothetical protein